MHDSIIIPITLSSKKGDCQQFWLSLQMDSPSPSIAPHMHKWEHMETCDTYRKQEDIRLPGTYSGFLLWRGTDLEHNNNDLAGWVTYPDRIVRPSPIYKGEPVGEVLYTVGARYDPRVVIVRGGRTSSGNRWLEAAITPVVLAAIDKHKEKLRLDAIERLRSRFMDVLNRAENDLQKLRASANNVIMALEGRK